MDWNRVEGNWKKFRGKVKEQWGNLTDDDLDVINGRREQQRGEPSGSASQWSQPITNASAVSAKGNLSQSAERMPSL